VLATESLDEKQVSVHEWDVRELAYRAKGTRLSQRGAPCGQSTRDPGASSDRATSEESANGCRAYQPRKRLLYEHLVGRERGDLFIHGTHARHRQPVDPEGNARGRGTPCRRRVQKRPHRDGAIPRLRHNTRSAHGERRRRRAHFDRDVGTVPTAATNRHGAADDDVRFERTVLASAPAGTSPESFVVT
jgi:hypothetical protein